MRIIFVEFDPGSLQKLEMRLREESGSISAQVNFDWAGNLNPGQDNAFTTIRLAYENPDNPAKLIFVVADGLFADTPEAADSAPNAEPYPTREPEPWMLVQHPFNPRTSAWQVLTINGWANMPAIGSEYTIYDLRDGDESLLLTWDKTDNKYKTTSGATPEHSDTSFGLREDAASATATVRSVVFTLHQSLGTSWNGWYVQITALEEYAGTDQISSVVDGANTTLQIDVPNDYTINQVITRLQNHYALTGISPFNQMTVALEDGADGSATITGGLSSLQGGVDKVGGSFTIYQTTGTTAGQPQTPVKITLTGHKYTGARNLLDSSFLELNTDRNTYTVLKPLVSTLHLTDFSGQANNLATDAVWYDAVAGTPVTGQPLTYAFTMKLIYKRGTTENVIYQKSFSDSASDPNIVSQFSTSSERKKVLLEPNDEIYITLEALSNSTESDPRSKAITITGGTLLVEAYESEAALDVAQQITWNQTVYLNEALTQGTAHYLEFETPISREDFPYLRSGIRFARAEADWYREGTIDMTDYQPLQNRATAEALDINDKSNSRIVSGIFNNVRGRLDVYKGQGFIGWDDENQLLAQLKQWFWGDSEYIRGVKSYLFYTSLSTTDVWITERFER